MTKQQPFRAVRAYLIILSFCPSSPVICSFATCLFPSGYEIFHVENNQFHASRSRIFVILIREVTSPRYTSSPFIFLFCLLLSLPSEQVAFTRLMTRTYLDMAREKFRLKDQKCISYGPCQTPTLSFCVKRHREIQNFQREPYFIVTPTVKLGQVSKP